MKNIILFIVFILLCPFKVLAEINFKHYDISSGLSDNTINCIHQDKKGFIWIGTNNGLNRFDGNYFKAFSYSESPEYDIIYSIMEDSIKNVFLLGTNKGIILFSPQEETFEKVNIQTAENKYISKDVYEISSDKNGNIFINNYPDFYIIKKGKQTADRININIKGYLSSGMFTDDNNFLAGIANKGIFRYNILTGRYEFIGKHNHTPRVLYNYNNKNKFLIGTLSRGLFIMDKNSGEEYKIKSDIYDIENLYINTITKLKDNTFWIGSMNGIFILRNDTVINHIHNQKFNTSSLSDNDVLTIFQDKDNNIWVGTRNAGINYFPQESQYSDITVPSDDFNNITGSKIRCIENNGDGYLWVGFQDGGIALFNTKNNKFEFTPHKELNNLTSKIYCIEKNNEELWIGTYSDGIYKLNTKNNTIKHYYKNSQPNSLYVNEVYSIFTDSRNNTWIGTTEVLFLYNREEDNFSHISQLDGSQIRSITEDYKGNLWIASANRGVFRMSIDTGVIKQYEYNKNNDSLIYGSLTDIKCDKSGTIWISSKNGGICRYNEKTDSFIRITTDNGLPTNRIYGLIVTDGKIWASTDNSIICINTKTNKIKGYIGEENNLRPVIFTQTCGTEHNNILYWGASEGLVSVNPQRIQFQKNQYSVNITSFAVLNREISVADSSNSVTDVSVAYSKELVLKHNESTFSIGFSAMDYEHSNSGFYSYKLENLDKEWIIRKDIREVNYQNLKPGVYTFKIRYSHNGVNWNNPATEVKIIVKPPFWATYQAFIIYIILISLAIYLVARYFNIRRKERIENEKRRWEEQKKEELYKAKSDFFTYMAHEIRTPITLVKAPLEKIKNSNSIPQELKNEFNLMEYNVNRLHLILTDFLELRRLESGVFTLHPKKVNVNLILKMLSDSYSNAKNYGEKEITCLNSENELNIFADEEAIIAILGNLISNAVKYSHKKISITSREEGEFIKITVSNDGNPIPEHLKEKIFEPFVRNDNSTQEGTGIGLAFADMLAKRHNGTLKLLDNTEDITFELSIPAYHENKSVTTTEENKNKNTILLAEDNMELIDFMKNELSADYNILTANNGKEALDIISEHDVCLVISDVMMPVMDGMELCTNIKNNFETCHIPVILLTAKANHENKLKGIECGADVYIEKPFSIQYVRSWIKNIISNHTRIKEKFVSEPVENIIEDSYSGKDLEFLNSVKGYIEKNIEDEELNIDKIADNIGMSRSSFHRKIKALTGQPPGEIITMIRLDTAARLLKEPGCRVGEVCSKIGFKSVSHFSRSFQKRFGVSPKIFSTQKNEKGI